MRGLAIGVTFAIYCLDTALHTLQINNDSSAFIKLGKKYYFIEPEQQLNWFGAAHFCRTIGAQLATIESAEEMEAISDYLIENDLNHWFWVGGNDIDNKGHYTWVGTGKPVKYTYWHTGQPDNAFYGEDCICLWRITDEVTWNDNACTNFCRYICEQDEPPAIKFETLKQNL